MSKKRTYSSEVEKLMESLKRLLEFLTTRKRVPDAVWVVVLLRLLRLIFRRPQMWLTAREVLNVWNYCSQLRYSAATLHAKRAIARLRRQQIRRFW